MVVVYVVGIYNRAFNPWYPRVGYKHVQSAVKVSDNLVDGGFDGGLRFYVELVGFACRGLTDGVL
jgi:hypothetical protein